MWLELETISADVFILIWTGYGIRLPGVPNCPAYYLYVLGQIS